MILFQRNIRVGLRYFLGIILLQKIIKVSIFKNKEQAQQG